MHNTRLSIFILPVLIIGLSVFTTFVEENPSFASLFSISQVANPTLGEEVSQDINEFVSDTLEEAEEIIDEDLETPIDEKGSEIVIEEEVGVSEEQGNPDIGVEPAVEAPSEEMGQGGGGTSDNNENQSQSTPETTEVIPIEITPEIEENVVEEIPIDDAAILAEKIAHYEVSKSMISNRFQQNLLRLERARDEIRGKIVSLEQAGKDVSRANEALANLEDAIAQSKRYMRDPTKPESIGAVQSMLTKYVNNIRTSINTGYNQLFNVIKETQ